VETQGEIQPRMDTNVRELNCDMGTTRAGVSEDEDEAEEEEEAEGVNLATRKVGRDV
jgi:hypothetical protein